MFDIGFWELVVVGIVALIVLGPERLPVVARKVGHWVGRVRRFVSEAKGDIDREFRLQEIKKAIERDAGLDEIRNIIDTGRHTIEDEVKNIEYAVKALPDEQPAQPTEPVALQDENLQYGHTEHKINPLDLLEPPLQGAPVVPPANTAIPATPAITIPTTSTPAQAEPVPAQLPDNSHGKATGG